MSCSSVPESGFLCGGVILRGLSQVSKSRTVAILLLPSLIRIALRPSSLVKAYGILSLKSAPWWSACRRVACLDCDVPRDPLPGCLSTAGTGPIHLAKARTGLTIRLGCERAAVTGCVGFSDPAFGVSSLAETSFSRTGNRRVATTWCPYRFMWSPSKLRCPWS